MVGCFVTMGGKYGRVDQSFSGWPCFYYKDIVEKLSGSLVMLEREKAVL
jgi:hypothetical protein